MFFFTATLLYWNKFNTGISARKIVETSRSAGRESSIDYQSQSEFETDVGSSFCGDGYEDKNISGLLLFGMKKILSKGMKKILSNRLCQLWNGTKFKKDSSFDIDEAVFEQAPFRLSYEKYVDMPQGRQDDGGHYVDHWIVSVAGFCGGNLFFGRYAYCCGRRGFLKDVTALNTLHPERGWQVLPEFPGAGRQFLGCVSVRSSLYCWGGFSYTPITRDATKDELSRPKADPFAFRDGYRLDYTKNGGGEEEQQGSSQDNPTWTWTKLPDAPFYNLVAPGMCHFEGFDLKSDDKDRDDDEYNYNWKDDSLYWVGGADYDKEQFHTDYDRNGESPRLGATFLRFDITTQEFETLPSFPGRARFAHSTSCVNGYIYVHSGITGGVSFRMRTTNMFLADGWRYSISERRWERLQDVPFDVGNLGIHSVVLKNRYILMLGGAIPDTPLKMSERRWKDSRGWKEWLFGSDSWLAEDHNIIPSDIRSKSEKSKHGGVHSIHQRHPPIPFTWDRGNGQSKRVGDYTSLAMVYDTKRLVWYITDSMPLGNNGIMVVRGEQSTDGKGGKGKKGEVFAWGGESNMGCVENVAYGQHPKLVLKMIVEWNDDDF